VLDPRTKAPFCTKSLVLGSLYCPNCRHFLVCFLPAPIGQRCALRVREGTFQISLNSPRVIPPNDLFHFGLFLPQSEEQTALGCLTPDPCRAARNESQFVCDSLVCFLFHVALPRSCGLDSEMPTSCFYLLPHCICGITGRALCLGYMAETPRTLPLRE
jgi:hypothetical protein